MARAKRGFKRRKRHQKVLDRASGYVLGRGSQYKRAAEAVDRAHVYAYRDRKNRKRDFRRLWITRLSAAARENQLSYHEMMAAMKKSGILLNRKVLSNIAIIDPSGFKQLLVQVQSDALVG